MYAPTRATIRLSLAFSKRGEGPFCIGMPTFAFAPVERIAARPQALYEKAKAQVERAAKDGAQSGLLEQWAIQLERLEPGKHQAGPGCELIFFSGIFGPSECFP